MTRSGRTRGRVWRGAWRRGPAGCALLGLAASCAGPERVLRPATGEHVWPAAPAPPRVRFVGEITGPFQLPSGGGALHRVLFGPEAQPRLITPHAVAVDAGGKRAAISDPNAHCVHVVDVESGAYLAAAEVGAGGRLETPIGVAWGGDTLFVADTARGVIEVFTVSGDVRNVRHVRTLGGAGLARPAGLAYDAARGRLLVCDAGAHRLVVMDDEGTVQGTMGAPGGGEGQLRYPAHATWSADGTAAVSDGMNFRVQRFSAEGVWLGAFGRKGDAAGDFALPKGIAADGRGNVWVVDAQFENVQAFGPGGELLMALGREGHGPGEFWLPSGACIDGRERLWIADTYNRRVQVFQLLP